MKISKGAIAAGHPETAKTAELILRDGGNAFDAVVAAQLTACVAEPVLTSLGGGGFLLAKSGKDFPLLYDFFVQTPRQKKAESEIHFHPITADFGPVQQEFHIGAGSIATPGTVKGLYQIHKDLCTIPFSRLVEPAIELARKGLIMNSFQSHVLDVVKPIYLFSEDAREIFSSRGHDGRLTRDGDLLKQPLLADCLDQLARHGESVFYSGGVAESIIRLSDEKGGHLTIQDLNHYRVYKRKPLRVGYRNNSVTLNPPPSSGGILIAFALKLMETIDNQKLNFGASSSMDLIALIQKLTEKARIDNLLHENDELSEIKLLDSKYLQMYAKEIKKRSLSSRGTTQISIVDNNGNMASLTSSNGEGSGCMIPGTGIMLNNMLGEEDLSPHGFHTWIPDQRMTSMMTPGLLEMENATQFIFGSGGSNRIRTALFQLVVNLVDFNMTLAEAVSAPRIHFDSGFLNIESGFDKMELPPLLKQYPDHKLWNKKSLFFGGAHAVQSGPEGFAGFGDPRRGGVSILINN